MARKRDRDKGLEDAKARGRAYGEHEADRKELLEGVPRLIGTSTVDGGVLRRERIKTAERYAEWDFNGRPVKELDLEPIFPGRINY